jgi:uncharacterized protein YybS (DUF2232 family)
LKANSLFLLKILGKAAPFFMSAAFLLSGFFAVFAPLPLLFALYGLGWPFALLALGSNAGVIFFVGSSDLAQLYAWIVAPLLFGFWLFATRQKLSIVGKVYFTWLFQVVVFIGVIAIYARYSGISPLKEATDALTQFLEAMSSSPGTREQILAGMEPDVWKRETLKTLPVTFGLSLLVLTFANFYLMVGLDPRRKFSRMGLTRPVLLDWRMPEKLVWPMIIMWMGVLFGGNVAGGVFSEICLGGMKLAGAGYGIQGVAILSAQLDRWKIFGFFRSFLFISVLLFMMPLVLSVGFFDQWFDFRAKFRQSNKD